LASLALTLRETIRYRGSIAYWAWMLHRLSGLGVVLFLVLHVIDTSWAVFYPELYEHAIRIYQSPLFTIGEFILVAAVIYHAFNGLRIILFDFQPRWWKYQQRAAWVVLILTALVLIPVFISMMSHVLAFYSESPEVLPLTEVIASQIPFLIGMVAALLAALALSWVVGMIVGARDQGNLARTEGFWWRLMRITGVLIVPLVFMHLAAMHIIQGVFDINAAGASIVGVTVNADLPFTAEDGTLNINGINDQGSAVEFVAERWNFYAGDGLVAIYRVFDTLLLLVVAVHGFNGLRNVLTDYTSDSPLLRRTSEYVSAIGAIILIVVGGGALLMSVEMTSADFVAESIARLAGG
jgi:succinate dehydrogenase / fumarate reductase, cytochrome b subunit